MLTSSLYAELQAALPPGTPLYLGRHHLGEHDSPPRLVLIPRDDRYAPPERAALRPGRVLWTRIAGYELVIWGRSLDETESMVTEALTALRDVAPVNLEGGSWVDEAWTTLGAMYTIRFTIASPVVETETFATLESIAQECGGVA